MKFLLSYLSYDMNIIVYIVYIDKPSCAFLENYVIMLTFIKIVEISHMI